MVRAFVAAQRQASANAYLRSEESRLDGGEWEADRLSRLAVNYERSLAAQARRIESGLAACGRMLSALLRRDSAAVAPRAASQPDGRPVGILVALRRQLQNIP